MKQLTHGGDWAGYRAKFGHDALDFSANVSPLGLPEGIAQAIVNALPTADRYPRPRFAESCAKSSPQAKTYTKTKFFAATARQTLFFGSCSRKSRTAHYCPRRLSQSTASALKNRRL